jgi:hypothetical protein
MARTTDDPKERSVAVRLNAEDFAKLQRIAKRCGGSLSAAIRFVLRRHRPKRKKA